MSSLLPFASILENPTTTELVEFQFTGLVVVFSALLSIWVFLEILGKVFATRPATAPAAKPAPAPAATPVAAADSGPTPQLVAAISAAVHIALKGRRHRISSIQLSQTQTGWAVEGRREHFSSHRVR